MAKSKEKNKARELRKLGESIKIIAKRLNVSKGSASYWCRDIELSSIQIKRLHEKMLKGSYKGRIKGARIQYIRRLKKIKKLKKIGFNLLKNFSDRDLLLAGLGLYWGEGSKSDRKVKFSNSDPKMIKFILKWYKKVWKIKKQRITLHILINRIHKDRIKEVKQYWSKITEVPFNQFIKTTLIKAKNKKTYKNFKNHFGTLAIIIKKPSEIHYQIIGLLEAIAKKSKINI